MAIVTSWSPFFQSRVRMRGRAYHLADRVARVEPVGDEVVRAQVQGHELYTVTIRREGRSAVAECTCPFFSDGAYCKHIWATLLDLQSREGPGMSADELSGLSVRAPKARKRVEMSRPNAASEPQWLGRLSLLRSPSYDQTVAAAELLPAQRQLCYVVLPEMSARHGGLIVELRQRSPIATGWSKLKTLKLTADALAGLVDSTDRELGALLLGADRLTEDPFSSSYRSDRGYGRFRLPAGARRMLLKRMIETGRCFIDLDEDAGGNEVALRWDGDSEGTAWVLWMVASPGEEELVVRVELRRGEERLAIEQPQLIVGGPDGVVCWSGKAALFDDRDAFRWVSQFRDEVHEGGRGRSIHVPLAEVDRFLDRLYMLPQLPEIELPEGIGRTEQHVKPVPHLALFSPGSAQAQQWAAASVKNQLVARMWFTYADHRVNPLQPGRFVLVSAETEDDASMLASEHGGSEDTGAEQADAQALLEADGASTPIAQDESRLIRRDRRAERQAFATLANLGLRPVGGSASDTLLLPVKQMAAAVSELLNEGWVVTADHKAIAHASAPSLSIRSGIDWFELRGSVRYELADGGHQEVTLPEILAAARAGRTSIVLGDGSEGLLPEQWLAEHGLLTMLGKLQGDHLRFKSSQAAILDALLDERELTSIDERFAYAQKRLHEFRGIAELDAAEQFHGSLRAYQKQGLGWLAFLRWFGVGGILADDMGLGKTIQVLAMLQGRYRGMPEHADTEHAMPGEEGGAHRPSLVVAPRSVVFNWVDEAAKFTPDLRVQAYTGADREALRAAFVDHDVIITSFGLLRRDIEELQRHEFDYVVLDEAQAIKNPASQAAKASRLLAARHRLALTGTPVENHLGDLWSIFEFLNPGTLGSSARFGQLVRASVSGRAGNGLNGNGKAPDDTVVQVSAALRPFILRRTKKQVLSDLPEKTEQTIVCEMEPAQRQVYDELRQYYRGRLLTHLDSAAGASGERGNGKLLAGGAAFMVLEALLRLRQAACHPGLIDEKRADEPSAKLDSLLEMLADVIEEGHKALVFSQFTSMLALVRRKLEERNIAYAYLDGQTRDRREVVTQFQSDPKVPVFLISLKAGGFGLNLTAAEYVFILDPWWNPAVEQQAIDRTHRIGQTRCVFAYRMICQDTVEQRIVELQNRKRELADAIIGGEQNMLSSLSREDLEQLLS